MSNVPDALKTPLAELLLSIADDKLVLGHWASDWTGLAPILEEDIAFSAISQEEIAHADALYEVVSPWLSRSPDSLAFGRAATEDRCAELIELQDEFDWAKALVRQFFCDHLDLLRLNRLAKGSLEPLAALAGRIAAEETTHVDHADTWIRHLGKGTDESRTRVQAALSAWGGLAATLFEPTEGVLALEEAGLYPPGPTDMFEAWLAGVKQVLAEAGLAFDLSLPPFDQPGGRLGVHTDGFNAFLDEMCEVYRVEPEAAW
ncbi:MAG: 1,2-phenylacetyl-CoA epoxidase subunit PaaC [Planctomycetota bacterium]|jgi:ring-1,2-phenylacetyl-CoA epoxidase subunit PaaC